MDGIDARSPRTCRKQRKKKTSVCLFSCQFTHHDEHVGLCRSLGGTDAAHKRAPQGRTSSFTDVKEASDENRFRSRCEATPDNSELSMNVHGLNKSHGWQELHACSADMKGSNVLIQGRERKKSCL